MPPVEVEASGEGADLWPEPHDPASLPLDWRIVGAVVGAAFGCIFGAVLYGGVKWLGVESSAVRLVAFVVGPVGVGYLGFRRGPGRILIGSLRLLRVI